MQTHDPGEDVCIPSRSESMASLSSQSSHYTDQCDEDLSIVIAQYNEDEAEKENHRYGFPTASPAAPSSASGRKRKRSLGEEPTATPPRQAPRVGTQELAGHRSSGGSRDTLVTSISSTTSSNGSSRTLGPTPPAVLEHRTRHAGTRKNKSVVASPASPQVIPPSVVLPAAKPTPNTKPTSATKPPPTTKPASPAKHASPTKYASPTKPTPATRTPPATNKPLTVLPTRPTLSSHTTPETLQPPILAPAAWRPPEPVVVAHAGYHYTSYIEALPWGAQWELARYINTGFDIRHLTVQTLIDLRKHGTNAATAPEVKKFVERVVRDTAEKAAKDSAGKPTKASAEGAAQDAFAAAFAREHSVKLPWDELDKEEAILKDHPFGGIGCNQDEPFCAQDPNWYGGRVHFTACVRKDKDGQLKLDLDRPVLGSSNRFARRFGSRRFIRVRVQKDLLFNAVGDELKEYFRRPFIVGTAVFRAFYAKEQNVFLFRTNEEVAKDSRVLPPASESAAARSEQSILDFINWHNSLSLNADQTMVKWAARFALGLSNSVPGIRLDARNICFVEDIICDAFDGCGKPPSEMQMTDGCGLVNRAAMRLLTGRVGSGEDEPTAVQVRIAGAKGLLLVRHDLSPEDEEVPKLWLRTSQLKIRHTPYPFHERIVEDDADPALRTIDVLRASRMHTPARLSVETITNLAENGVPRGYFQRLFEVNLQERVGELLKHERPEDMQLLHHAVAREGGVIRARMAREAAGVARAKGLIVDDYDDDLEDEDEDGLDGLDRALREQSRAWWEDPVSGCPSSLEETCLFLLDSGFLPRTCPVLQAKLKEVAKKVVTTFEARYKFAVPMSCSAFIVPDPFGVLGPNEIHVKSSRREFVDADGRQTDLVLGDVLVTRHPCKVPSDVQKVKAVFHDNLRHYCNVIVVSTKSAVWQGQPLNRHLASLTGGGDYDGDTMEVFWDPAMVSAFNVPDPHLYASEPPEVQKSLVKNTETVSAFLARVPPSTSDEYQIFALQDYLLGALRGRSYVSEYSVWWEKSTYAQGYAHPETVFLAYMFCAILDGIKTGVTIDPVAFGRHKAKWSQGALNWKVTETDEDRRNPLKRNPLITVKRDSTLPKFIMDSMAERVRHACELQRKRIDNKLVTTGDVQLDEDLARPYRDAEARAARLEDAGEARMALELGAIRRHVEEMHARARARSGKRASSKSERGSGSGKASFTSLPIERRQDILREQSKEFHAHPAGLLCFSESEATAVKASYAYIYDHAQGVKKLPRWSRFPWDVAMRALCEIKAKACGGSKTVADGFYRYFELSRAYIRQRKQEEEG